MLHPGRRVGARMGQRTTPAMRLPGTGATTTARTHDGVYAAPASVHGTTGRHGGPHAPGWALACRGAWDGLVWRRCFRGHGAWGMRRSCRVSFFLATPESKAAQQQPNARHELLGMAGARYERTLFPVSSMPLFGWLRLCETQR